MRNRSALSAARGTTLIFGMLAGLGGLIHGIGEVLQGNVRPDGVLIDSWTQGPIATNMGGEPAMTIVPNLLATGILTILLAVAVMAGAALARNRSAGWMLLLLSVSMLLVGGGFGPPIMGILASLAMIGSGAPSDWWHRHASTRGGQLVGTLWPWVFGLTVLNGVFLVIGSLILVYVFDLNNPELFVGSFFVSVLSLLLTLFVGRAHDVQRGRYA